MVMTLIVIVTENVLEGVLYILRAQVVFTVYHFYYLLSTDTLERASLIKLERLYKRHTITFLSYIFIHSIFLQ